MVGNRLGACRSSRNDEVGKGSLRRQDLVRDVDLGQPDPIFVGVAWTPEE